MSDAKGSQSQSTRHRPASRVYEFSDINYVNKDEGERENICLSFCKFLNSMNVDFKMHVVNEPRDMEEVEQEALLTREEGKGLAELVEANNRLIQDVLKKGNPQIKKKRYLTVTCRRQRYEDARAYFNVLETAVSPVFLSMRSRLAGSSIGTAGQSCHLKAL